MKNKKSIIIITVIAICVLAVVLGICFLNGNEKTDTKGSSKSNKFRVINGRMANTVEEYKEIMNNELKNSEYSDYSIKNFEKVVTEDIGTSDTELIYNLYQADITENLQIYLLTNDINNHIDQIRYRVDLNSEDVTFEGYLLGATMRLLYNKIDDDELNTFYTELGINSPTEGMNKTYEFNDNLYRTTVKNNYLTIYLTNDNSSYFEEKYVKIITEEEEKSNAEALAKKEAQEKILDAQELYFDNTDIRWGMSPEELEDVKSVYENYRDWDNAEGEEVIYYYDTVYSNAYNLEDIQYWFYKDNNKLNSCMLDFNESNEIYSSYEEVRDVLIGKYGQPTSEKLNFSDETYKDDLEKSLKYKYLEIRTTWTNQPDFDIIIQWGDGVYTITYCEKGYGGNY